MHARVRVLVWVGGGGCTCVRKSCPNCRADRGYAETFRLLGVDELVNGISAKEPAAATTERNSTPDVFESDNDDLVIPP